MPTKKATSDESSAGGRSLWSGSISFGLVQIPVKMRTAERVKELAFHQLDKRDHARIHYERVNAKTGKKVEWNDIVKGYEMSRGAYVVVDDKDLERANIEATHTIDIQDFVKRSEIPVEFFERPYYLVPERNGKRAYGVLRDALAGKGLVAIALVVIRTKQHLAAIMPDGDALVLVLMRFESEMVPLSSVAKELPRETKASPQERKLADQLVEALTAKWNASKYVDTYTRDLLAALKEKAETGTIAAPDTGARATTTAQMLDLVSLLQESVARSANVAAGAHKAPRVKRGSGSAGRHRKKDKEHAA
jgi:DNA end-binding protein Ku